jgi:hypothetical protein
MLPCSVTLVTLGLVTVMLPCSGTKLCLLLQVRDAVHNPTPGTPNLEP